MCANQPTFLKVIGLIQPNPAPGRSAPQAFPFRWKFPRNNNSTNSIANLAAGKTCLSETIYQPEHNIVENGSGRKRDYEQNGHQRKFQNLLIPRNHIRYLVSASTLRDLLDERDLAWKDVLVILNN